MTTKENILRLIDSEMTTLITVYEKRLKELDQQVVDWKEKVSYLEWENAKLKKQVTDIFLTTNYNYEILLHQIKRLNGDIPYDLIDEWCLSSSVEGAFMLFATCEELWINQDLKKLNYIMELIVHNLGVFQHNDENVTKTFLYIIEKVIMDETIKNEQFEKLISSIIKVFRGLQKSFFITDVAKFVEKYNKEMFNQVLIINEPKEIITFLRMLMVYELKSEVKSALIHILDVEWEYIDSALTNNDFTILLWYCYLFDFSEDLIELSSKSLPFFDENIEDQKLYFYIYENKNLDKQLYKVKVDQFLECSILTDYEKKLVLHKVDDQAQPMFENLEISKLAKKTIINEDYTDRSETKLEEIKNEYLPTAVQENFRKVNAFELLNQLLSEKKFVECSKIVTRFNEQADPGRYSLESLRKLERFLDKVFRIVPAEIKEMENLYFACLKTTEMFRKKQVVEQFITKNENVINQRILNTNKLKLIVKLADFYFKANYDSKLSFFLRKVFDNWNPNFTSMEYSYFVKMLWYSFYTEKEDQFLILTGGKISLEEFNSHPEIEIINQYLKIKNNPQEFNDERSKILALKEKESSFNKNDRKKLYSCLEQKIGKLAKTNRLKNKSALSTENKSLRKIAFVTKLTDGSQILKSLQSHLRKELVQLAIYQDPFLKNQNGFTLVEVLVDEQNGKSYILEEDLRELKKKIGSKWPDIRAFKESVPVVHKNEMDIHSRSFNWPSTNIKGGTKQEEKPLLHDESELKKMGYQITGMTRNKRWQILEVAVKQLGLKKVAYTIAQNVKLRKGQKNGASKFSYAIGEWEYDLNILKQKFYKNDFTWPNTKVNH